MTADPRLQSFSRSGPRDVPPGLKGGFAAIGNFDGMHRGHQSVLGAAQSAAERAGEPCVMVTFEPHPRDYFARGAPVFRLTPPATKARLASALGLSGMVTVPFDRTTATTQAEAFIDTVLVGGLAVAGVAVGWDFHFGAGRRGTPALLADVGRTRGFDVVVVEPFRSEDGELVSSSRIRTLLAAGDIAGAAGLLGYRWFFEGAVIHGDKRGRDIGYPTANMGLPGYVELAHGIYAVMVEFDGERRPGVASFGHRPTFDNGAPLFETHLFDFAGDLYGRTLTITPVARLRPEMRFDSVAALVEQMDRDSAEARALLHALAPVSPLDRALLFG